MKPSRQWRQRPHRSRDQRRLLLRRGAIPLCNVLHQTFPDAEILLTGVEEPRCLIHAPNESVDPAEIEHMALAEALFLANYPT